MLCEDEMVRAVYGATETSRSERECRLPELHESAVTSGGPLIAVEQSETTSTIAMDEEPLCP